MRLRLVLLATPLGSPRVERGAQLIQNLLGVLVPKDARPGLVNSPYPLGAVRLLVCLDVEPLDDLNKLGDYVRKVVNARFKRPVAHERSDVDEEYRRCKERGAMLRERRLARGVIR